MYTPGYGVEGATELIVLKNRNGPTGFVDLYFYRRWMRFEDMLEDRKSTRLNSSHGYISYAVFCLKKKKNEMIALTIQKELQVHAVRIILSTGYTEILRITI